MCACACAACVCVCVLTRRRGEEFEFVMSDWFDMEALGAAGHKKGDVVLMCISDDDAHPECDQWVRVTHAKFNAGTFTWPAERNVPADTPGEDYEFRYCRRGGLDIVEGGCSDWFTLGEEGEEEEEEEEAADVADIDINMDDNVSLDELKITLQFMGPSARPAAAVMAHRAKVAAPTGRPTDRPADPRTVSACGWALHRLGRLAGTVRSDGQRQPMNERTVARRLSLVHACAEAVHGTHPSFVFGPRYTPGLDGEGATYMWEQITQNDEQCVRRNTHRRCQAACTPVAHLLPDTCAGRQSGLYCTS